MHATRQACSMPQRTCGRLACQNPVRYHNRGATPSAGPRKFNRAFRSPRHETWVGRRAAAVQATGDESAPVDPKSRVAKMIVKDYVSDDMVVGIDSGEMCTMVLQEIAAALEAGTLSNVRALPTSNAAANEAAFVGVPQTISADHEEIDVMFAAVDEIDVTKAALPFIFGRSAEPTQPQIPRFKGVARKAKLFVALLDTEDKAVARLGSELPVVVYEEDWEETGEDIDDIFLGIAEVWRRGGGVDPDPRGGDMPYVSEEGYTILDIRFYDMLTLGDDTEAEYSDLNNEIMDVEGSVSCALLEDVANVLVICNGDTPKVITKEEILNSLVSPESTQ